MRSEPVSAAVLCALVACAQPVPVAVTPAPPPIARRAAPVPLAVQDGALDALDAAATITGARVADVAPRGAATIVVVFASWCGHCREELATIDGVRARHPGLRTLGVSYRAHEEYDGNGDAARVRAYVDEHAPWLVVVPVDEPVFTALGRPPKVPTIYVYDAAGELVDVYDRRARPPPTAAELDALLTRLGA
jgi:thiol-disulfide isomerase/thioredoxin